MTGRHSLSGGHCLSGRHSLSGLAPRSLRFVATGLVGFVAQIAGLAVLTRIGVHYLVATAIAVEIAILCNFVCRS